jgi:hypothetical protein
MPARKGKTETVGQRSLKGVPLSEFPELLAQWHPTRNGIQRPEMVSAGSPKKVWWACNKGSEHEWQATPFERARRNGGCPFCANQRISLTNSFAAQHPEIAAEWCQWKNGELTPHSVVSGSGKRAWWVCRNNKEHIWQAAIRRRVEGTGCPYCAGQLVSRETSIAGRLPALANEWHPTRNGALTPEAVHFGSNKRVWWRCKANVDHEWATAVSNRARSGHGCPFCAGQRATPTTSLAFLNPELAKQWHPRLNGELTPSDVKPGSDQAIWWACATDPQHEWRATPSNRTRLGSGCPVCAGRVATKASSLATRYPDIAAEWHRDRNQTRPTEILPSSNKKAWWMCRVDPSHAWQAVIGSRVAGRGCPYCANRKVSSTNSLTSKHPSIAAEWHPKKNSPLTASDVLPGSQRRVWWQCSSNPNHEWTATLNARTSGNRCPVCFGNWSVEAVRAFIESLLPHIAALTPAERYAIFQQSGVLGVSGKAKRLVAALTTGRFPQGEVERFAHGEPSLADEFLKDDQFSIDDVARPATVELIVESAVAGVAQPVEKPELPLVQTRDALAALDHQTVVSADAEAVEFLLASARAKIWAHAYRDPASALEQAESFTGGVYPSEVRNTFIREFSAASELHIPEGYAFSVCGKLTFPNLMQRLVAVRVRDERRLGNWSGTGAGKTLSAVLATRVVDARLTVVCCPNAVVQGWETSIKKIFPDSQVQTKSWAPQWRTDGPRYLVLNYEMFQQSTSEGELKSFLEREVIDFAIIDEIHFAKQRHSDNFSQRKRLVMALVSGAGDQNAELCVLGMSATPVINNLQEGKSLIELITGMDHAEIATSATVQNCMKLYQRLVTLGTRWMPDYAAQLERVLLPVDCTALLGEIRALGKSVSPLDLEKILTQARLPSILEALRSGRRTLIYTHYVDGIDKIIYDAVTKAGFSAGMYTGEDKTGLERFLRRDIDVLIGSSAIGTGVDGLQHVCDQIVINVLPWTHAEYQQLIGRVHRQGQRSASVRVVVPATFAFVNGERWSYCDSKLARIDYKKSIADAAVDGDVPEGNLRSPAQAQADLMAWLRRLETGQPETISRRPIVVSLDGGNLGTVTARAARYGEFSVMNARWNRANSAETFERLKNDPAEWEFYHTQYRKAREAWTIVPVLEVIEWARQREGYVIGDFGCGEAMLAAELRDRHVVHSFDHVAIHDGVIPGDMRQTSLEDGCLDVAVFSLSLMGANFIEYLREAHRVLRIDGQLLIWEARSRFDDPTSFCSNLERLGFRVHSPEERGKFLYIEARKTERKPDPDVSLSFRE